jgi:hypothetical protein
MFCFDISQDWSVCAMRHRNDLRVTALSRIPWCGHNPLVLTISSRAGREKFT